MASSRREALAGIVALGVAAGLLPATASAAVGGAATVGTIDRILVLKRKRTLMLMRGPEVAHSFRVALGKEPRGAKLREGDGRTPEGSYRIDARNPSSQFYRAMRISYPNATDRARAREQGVRPGGQIMLHGLDPAIQAKWRDDHWMFNWTRGCIAVTNAEMDVIWSAVAVGTPIDIHP
jgi:murein L,D-transpeptidase YafK